MLKILILGASSDIGKDLISLIISKNINNLKIHAHVNSSKNTFKKYSNVKIIKSNFLLENEKKILKKFDSNYDILINLVGFIANKKFENIKLNNVINSIKVNSIIPFQIFRKSTKKLIFKKRGVIINTSSIGVKFGGGENTFGYSLSKHLNEFIPKYFRNLIKYNILYNVVRIGVVNTRIHNKISNKDLNKRVKLIPRKKLLEVREVSEFIYFLMFKNKTICNEILPITGGE